MNSFWWLSFIILIKYSIGASYWVHCDFCLELSQAVPGQHCKVKGRLSFVIVYIGLLNVAVVLALFSDAKVEKNKNFWANHFKFCLSLPPGMMFFG